MDHANAESTASNPNTALPTTASTNVSKKWFSNIGVDPENPGTRPVSPGPGSGHIDVDEAYRVKLSSKLHVRSSDESLPSTEFLNLCIRMYFTRFNPIFPLLHGPTFQPSAKNSLLLLSICSVGSLFIGSADAIAQGTRIFERLNKAILASWEQHLARGGGEALSMIQAATIGQTFGLLSGNPWHLTMVDAFHGTVVSWARRSKMFSCKQAVLPSSGITGRELSLAWRRWAQKEEIVRITLGLQIHDSELASIFHHEPILRHNSATIPLASSSTLFGTSNADQWIATLQKEERRMNNGGSRSNEVLDSRQNFSGSSLASPGSFTAYAFLAGIAARICETRKLGELDESARSEFVKSLVEWHQEFSRSRDTTDPLCLMVLWHSTFMTLLADLDMLERAVGRDTPEALASSTEDFRRWVSSLDAKRCIVHGLLAHKHVKELQMGMEPAIHIPRTLFQAGMTLFCYTLPQVPPLDMGRDNSPQALLALPEMKLIDPSSAMYIFEPGRKCSDKISAIEASALCNITDLLQRIGHWEIARKYASTLESVLHGG
ncbi:Fungal specific transcription factor domain containing protein [Hyaloscypha variabilis]